jgi:hypothetical protein
MLMSSSRVEKRSAERRRHRAEHSVVHFFGWWLCLMHIFSGIAQCLTIIGIPVGIANLKSPPSPSGRWGAGSSLWKPRVPRVKPMRVVAFSNRTEHGHD